MESSSWDGVRRWAIGRFRFDSVSRQLDDGSGQVVSLTVKTAAVLQRLAERHGDVVLRDELIRDVWDGNAYTGTRALTQVVWKLRRLLDGEGEPADGVGAIRTVSKTGYQLVMPAAPQVVEALEQEPALTSPPPSPTLPVAQRPRRTAAWAALAAALLLVAGAGALLWRAAPERAATAGVDAVAPQPLTMLDGVEDYPAFSPDGRRLAFVWSRPGDADRVRIVDPQRPDASPLDLRDDAGWVLARPMWLGSGTLAYARAHDGDDCEIIAVELATLERRRVAGCFYQRRLAFVDASPDGRWLALARHRSGTPEVAIVLHELDTGTERVLSKPDGGHDDGQISFSRSGEKVAFVRGGVTVGDVWVVDVASGVETRLTHDQAPVGGLSWLADDSGIVFSSVRDGSFANWRVPAGGGAPTLFSRADAAVNLAAIPGEPNAVAATLHKFSDSIQVLVPNDAAANTSFASNGRNLYAQPCPSADRLVFLSTRGSRVGLWTSDARGDHLRALQLPPGTPDTAACAPNEARWASVVRPPGAATDSLVLGHLDRPDEAPRVLPQPGALNNVSWSLDGQSLVVASDRDGGWDLWRYELAGQRYVRLTDDHGSFGREVQTPSGRWLYYARSGERGLWRRALAADGSPSGAPEAVTDRLAPEDWGNWQWHDGALWLVQRDAGGDHLVRCEADGAGAQVVRSFPARQIRRYRSLAIDPSGRLVVSASGSPQADLVRLRGPN